MSTYLLHFNKESVNVVSGVAWIQVLLVLLHLLAEEVLDDVKVLKECVVFTWQVLHDSREGVIELLQKRRETFVIDILTVR